MDSRRSIAVAVLLGTAVLILLASSSFGRGDAPGTTADRKLHPQPERLATVARGSATAAATKGTVVRYLDCTGIIDTKPVVMITGCTSSTRRL